MERARCAGARLRSRAVFGAGRGGPLPTPARTRCDRGDELMSDRGLVLVTGATGAMGPAVVRELIHSGYRVRSFSRTHASPPHRGVEMTFGDIADAEAVRAALTGV